MDWTTMPKATIDKYSDLGTTEEQISGGPQLRLRTTVDTIPQAKSVRGPSYVQLRLGITPTVALHHRADRRAGSPR